MKFTRAAALVELNGEALMLKLSVEQWGRVFAIASESSSGQLPVARVPNQAIFEAINQTATRKKGTGH